MEGSERAKADDLQLMRRSSSVLFAPAVSRFESELAGKKSDFWLFLAFPTVQCDVGLPAVFTVGGETITLRMHSVKSHIQKLILPVLAEDAFLNTIF